METLIKSLTTHATSILPVVFVCILTFVGLFLLSRGYKSESQVALDSLFVIKNLLATQLGEKGRLLVDIWIKGLQNIQDGECMLHMPTKDGVHGVWTPYKDVVF